MNSYLLWAIKETGETNSASFGSWVSIAEAINTVRQDYPESVAILDPLTNGVLWVANGFEIEV